MSISISLLCGLVTGFLLFLITTIEKSDKNAFLRFFKYAFRNPYLGMNAEQIKYVENEVGGVNWRHTFKDIWKSITYYKDGACCVRCGTIRGIALEFSDTAYHYDGDDPSKDPNRPSLFCRPCALEDREQWEEMWREYWRGCY